MFRFRVNRLVVCVATLVAVLAIHGHAAVAADEAVRLEVGQPFPIILLPRLEDGLPDTLVNYRGQKLIMHIFASW